MCTNKIDELPFFEVYSYLIFWPQRNRRILVKPNRSPTTIVQLLRLLGVCWLLYRLANRSGSRVRLAKRCSHRRLRLSVARFLIAGHWVVVSMPAVAAVRFNLSITWRWNFKSWIDMARPCRAGGGGWGAQEELGDKECLWVDLHNASCQAAQCDYLKKKEKFRFILQLKQK